MNDRTANLLIFLTFVGMVGLYIGLWMAYQKYLQYEPALQKLENTGSSVTGLITSLAGGS